MALRSQVREVAVTEISMQRVDNGPGCARRSRRRAGGGNHEATVSRQWREVVADVGRLSPDFIRHELRLTGTVSVKWVFALAPIGDGDLSVMLMFAAQADACDIRTVEGLAGKEGLSPLVRSMNTMGAMRLLYAGHFDDLRALSGTLLAAARGPVRQHL
jgi:hypothetical protein